MCILPKTVFSSPADNWIVITKQHCLCALKELRNERPAKGLDPPQWMQVVKVNLLKTETSWATRVSIARQKQAIDLNISAVPPSEPADNFLLHLRDLMERTFAGILKGATHLLRHLRPKASRLQAVAHHGGTVMD